MEIFQIVSRLPPAIDGVGDYAFLLAKQLRAAHDIHTRFVVCDPTWKNAETLKPEILKSAIGSTVKLQPSVFSLQPSTMLDGFPVYQLRERSAAELLRVLSQPGMPQTVLLQYVGYGYEKRGCPVWLVNALREWKNAEKLKTKKLKSVSGCQHFSVSDFMGVSAQPRLIAMFHELYAFGPPWRSSFWTSPIQQWLAARLCRAADTCVTNLKRYARWLAAQERRFAKQIVTIPVFSNVGELSRFCPLTSRSPTMVIFGSPRWTKALLGEHRIATLTCCRNLGLEQIVTVGSPVGTAPTDLRVAVRERGVLQADKVAEIMASSRVGMMDYFPGYLAKSGVFAAYAAFGLIPLLPRSNPSELDGCENGHTYLLPDQIATGMPPLKLQKVADNARTWYEGHRLSRTAATYNGILKARVPAC